jgi:adenosylhomocysteine nucleosidase
MKIGIIVAMDKEYELLQGVQLAKHEICLVKSGIGKVNAAIATMQLVHDFQPDLVINSGVAGGIDTCLQVADLVIGTQTCYHDFFAGDVSDHLKELGFEQFIQADAAALQAVKQVAAGREDVKFGLGCTGDQFITTKEELFQIKNKYPEALFVDMESNAIAHVCAKRNVPFISLRIISDTPWVDNHAHQYANFWVDAPQKNFELVRTILEAL